MDASNTSSALLHHEYGRLPEAYDHAITVRDFIMRYPYTSPPRAHGREWSNAGRLIAERPGMWRLRAALLLAVLATPACGPSQVAERPAPEVAAPLFLVLVEPADAVVVGPDASPLVRRPCRDLPTGLTGCWSPERRDILVLEAGLARAVDDHWRTTHPDARPRTTRAYRQYTGMFRNGTPVVYVNAMPTPFAERHYELWREGHLQVCDGGPEFFGIVFTPSTGEFDSFEANGPF